MSPARLRAALVVNAGSGSAGSRPIDAALARLEAAFDLTVHEVGPGRDPAACARAALAAGADVVIAAGGDGTVSAVGSVLVGRPEAALGVLPRGTANSVAAALGIPDDLDGACDVLIAGHRRAIDAARCGDRGMLLHCSVGVHAETIGETSTEAKQRWGALAYLATAIKKLGELAPFEAELTTDEHTIRCRAIAVTAANLAPRKTLVAQGPAAIPGDDGLLSVTVLAATSLVEAALTGVHLFRTASQEEPATRDDVGYFACRTLRIDATPPQQVLIDGEEAGLTPVTIELMPRSLLVLAPPADASPPAVDAKLDGLPDLEIEPR